MKSSPFSIGAIGVLVSTQSQSSMAFIAGGAAGRNTNLNSHQINDGPSCDRLAFLKTIASVAVASPLVAFADDGVEDLAMPSADEQKAQDVGAYYMCCPYRPTS
jgi:hypothetical protein